MLQCALSATHRIFGGATLSERLRLKLRPLRHDFEVAVAPSDLLRGGGVLDGLVDPVHLEENGRKLAFDARSHFRNRLPAYLESFQQRASCFVKTIRLFPRSGQVHQGGREWQRRAGHSKEADGIRE